MTSAADDLARPPTDSEVAQALARFAHDVRQHYGERVQGLYLFGSRARGDHRPDSDVDVAVVLADGAWTAWAERWTLNRMAYEPGLDSGLFIQVWVFSESHWNDASPCGATELVHAARRDARLVGGAS